jgi:hypothetical protein
MLHVDNPNVVWNRASHCHSIVLLENLIIHVKNMSFPNFQEVHDDFDLQNRLFLQRVIVMEFISDDLS